MYTHTLKTSGQRCFPAVWWPTKEVSAGPHEKKYPLMMLESGQVTRVRASNLLTIKNNMLAVRVKRKSH